MQQVMEWLGNPLVKAGLLWLGGQFIKRWPGLVTKTVPVLLLGLSVLTEAVALMFPVVMQVEPASYVVAALSTTKGWGAFVFQAVIPCVLAVGAHSGIKNLKEWAEMGYRWFYADRAQHGVK